MTYAARPSDFHGTITPARTPANVKASPRPGFLARLFNALFESRQQAAEREVEAYLSRTGHRFTDSVERELNERMLRGDWSVRR